MRLSTCPVRQSVAQEFIRRYHRHHPPQVGQKFCVGAMKEREIVGVAVVGRPVARMLDDGWTLEVTRLATDGERNACSLLYGASARAAKALGYSRIFTYTLASEHGSSLRAAGWTEDGGSGGGSWSRPSRHREDVSPTEAKTRWSKQWEEVPSFSVPTIEFKSAQVALFTGGMG